MKRLITLLLASVMLVALVSGCRGESTTSTPDATIPPPRDTVNLALVGVVSSLDPYATAMTVDLEVFHQIYESLYYVDDYSEAHPRLALTHEISQDGTVYTFKIRNDALFHNGDPVTVDDVVFSFQKAMASGVMAPYVGIIQEVKKVGEDSVQMTLEQAYTPFLNNTTNVFIVNKKAFESAGDKFGSTVTGAGTGPYKVVSFDGNTKVSLEAFDKYYQGAAPIKYANYIVMADVSAGLIAFEKGELDFYAIPPTNWSEISSSGKYTSSLSSTTHINYVLLNPSSGILKNQDLRYAISYAVDRDAINEMAYEGLAEPAYNMMRPGYIFGASDSTFTFSYDPVKAKEYLVKAGYPNGVDIGELQYLTANYFPKIAQTFQAQLAAVGITCTISGGQTSQLAAAWRAGEFHMLSAGFNAMLDYDYYTRYSSPAVSTSFLKYQNTDYDADWVVEMYNKGAAELDPVKRQAIYEELENFIAKTACYIPIFFKTLPYAWNKDLTVELDMNWYYLFNWSWK